MPLNNAEGHPEYLFRLDQCGDLTPLRQALETAGYTQSALTETVVRHDHTGRFDTSVLLRRTAPPTPYNILVRLFFLAQPVPVLAARSALTPMPLEQLMAIGLLKQSGSDIRAEAMLLPGEDFLLAHDFSAAATGRPERANHVLGVGQASITLANLTVRRRDETVLDLGTGSGFQALLAARHAARVIATDLNPRALNFAAFNARLNSVSNLERRQGSLYAPVETCQFDLIVANPPFVISPEVRYLYRDGGLPGDALSAQVVRGASARLQEGGYAVILCNWHHQGEDWSERLRPWVALNGCDAWLLCFRTDDPLTYASNWLRSTEGHDLDHYERLLDAWLQYYQQMGITYISYGLVLLRRRSVRANWLRTDTVPSGQGAGSCSAQIQRIFAAQDFLEGLRDEQQLLDYAFLLAPEHQLEHILKAEDGGWTVKEAILKQAQGLQFTGYVDRLVSTVLAGCDSHHTLRTLIADVAHGLGVDFDTVAPACLEVVRKLLQMGFLSMVAP
jgi:methylase of polypeptide subunit release factors